MCYEGGCEWELYSLVIGNGLGQLWGFAMARLGTNSSDVFSSALLWKCAVLGLLELSFWFLG